MRYPVTAVLLLAACGYVQAQGPIGSVKTEGAEVSGMVSVSGGRATIGSNGAVSAGVQPADVTLRRGGVVRVCSGSSVHLSQPTMAVNRPPLMLAVDRGAVEIRTDAEKTDSILTPDLRFELSDGAPLDLRIRTVPNGDTCVDNAGRNAPMIHVTETFGTGAYLIRPGQRVLFEHGSLREVVDHETSNCGCPRPDDLVLAGKGKMGSGKVTEAAKANPFPEAVSSGLQQPEAPQTPAAAPGETHTQVSTALNYSGTTNSVSGPPGQVTTTADIAPVTAAPVTAAAAPQVSAAPAKDVHMAESTPPPPGPNPFRAIGRFFRHLFGVQ